MLLYLNKKIAMGDKIEQHRQIKSIEEVQGAEARAARLVMDAQSEKEKAIADAREKASEMIAKAAAEARARREDAIKKAGEDLEKRGKKELERALRESKSIRGRGLGPHKRRELAIRLVRSIFGA